MKKIILFFMISSIVLLMVGCNASAANYEPDYDSWFAPYQEVIDEVNDKNGWNLTVVDSEAFYRMYKDYTLDEAKDDIIEQYSKILTGEVQSDLLEISDTSDRVIVSALKSVDSATQLAYMDLNQVSDEILEGEILEARRAVIYSSDWCADDMDAYIFDTVTGETKDIPKFHDIFPENWDLPVNENYKDTNTSEIQPRSSDFENLKTYLEYPSDYELTSPFKTFCPDYYIRYWCGANSIPGASWNFGVTNMDDGTDRLSSLYLSPTESISFSVRIGTNYGLRASTYSTEGYAYMRGGSGFAG